MRLIMLLLQAQIMAAILLLASSLHMAAAVAVQNNMLVDLAVQVAAELIIITLMALLLKVIQAEELVMDFTVEARVQALLGAAVAQEKLGMQMGCQKVEMEEILQR